MHIIPYTSAHLDAVAALLVERHRADRHHMPELPARYEEPAQMCTAVEEALPALDTGVVVAVDDGDVVGVLGARYVRPAPDDFMALVIPPRTARVSELLQATAPGAEEVLRDLYAALAERWVVAGYFVHLLELPAWHDAATTVWCSLGFGRLAVRGLRDLRPPEAGVASTGVEVREAGPEDVAEVARLAMALRRFHAGPPIFMPYVPEAAAGATQMARERLTSPDHVCFLAVRDGRTLGYMELANPGTAPVVPERTAYLNEAYTEESARGSGTGGALLARSLASAREAGYTHCSVNWVSTNLVASRFWTGHGFQPMRLRLARRVDERIAWAGSEAGA